MPDALADVFTERILSAIQDRIESAVTERLKQMLPGMTAEANATSWMTTDQAATYLALRPDALRARARRGTVPAHRDDDRWLYNRAELDAFIREGDYR